MLFSIIAKIEEINIVTRAIASAAKENVAFSKNPGLKNRS